MAWSIGGNDVANSMGTSVGSGALTIRKAVILAGLMNFAGATLIGVHVTKTIKYGIIDQMLFIENPYIFMYGMIASLLAAAIWITISTYFSLPISTSHSIVGAVLGFGIIAVGTSAVSWGKIIEIGASWVLSPLAGGAVAFLIFYIIKKVIFNAKNPIESTKKTYPIFTFALISIILSSFFIGVSSTFFPTISLAMAAGIILFVSGLSSVLSYLYVSRHVLKTSHRTDEETYACIEQAFVYLQIITAGYVAFAHGSNDVANAIGPLSSVLSILETGTIESIAGVPLWLVALGGFGIAVGIATWGYRVIATIAKKITQITPTRGFSAELSTALVVLICSRLGLPVSTSQVLVGSVIGIGFAKGIVAIDLGIIKKIITGWILTVPISAATTAGIFICLRFLSG
jgi:PiT family inorganic phosphate transporter